MVRGFLWRTAMLRVVGDKDAPEPVCSCGERENTAECVVCELFVCGRCGWTECPECGSTTCLDCQMDGGCGECSAKLFS